MSHLDLNPLQDTINSNICLLLHQLPWGHLIMLMHIIHTPTIMATLLPNQALHSKDHRPQEAHHLHKGVPLILLAHHTHQLGVLVMQVVLVEVLIIIIIHKEDIHNHLLEHHKLHTSNLLLALLKGTQVVDLHIRSL